MYLIYINRILTTNKGEHIFEFLFSNSVEWEWDDTWYESSVMTDTKGELDETIVELLALKTDELNLELVRMEFVIFIME